MVRTLAFGSMLLLVLLPGCSDSDGPPTASSTSTSAAEQITNATDLPGGKVLPPPNELFNQTYRYPRLPGDSGFGATFDVDNTSVTLRFAMQILADCPAPSGDGNPRVEFVSPAGTVHINRDFGVGQGGSFSSLCPTSQPTGQRDGGTTYVDGQGEVGQWEFRSYGNFTGNVRIIVTSNPPA